MHRTIALFGLGLGLAALVLHLIAIVSGDAAVGIVSFVTSLAVVANILAALVYASVLFDGAAFSFFRGKAVQGLAATAMAFAMLFYHLVAAGEAEGIALIANVALNYIAPTLFVAYWMVYLANGSLRLHHVASWMLFPALYIVWMLLMGTITGTYGYEVLDVAADGWGAVAVNYLTFLAAFVVLAVFAIGFDTEKKPETDHAPQH